MTTTSTLRSPGVRPVVFWSGLVALALCVAVIIVTGPAGIITAVPFGVAWLLVASTVRLRIPFRVAAAVAAVSIALSVVVVLADGLLVRGPALLVR